MLGGIDLRDFLEGPWAGRRAILADLDGCLLAGGTVLPQAAELVARHARQLWIVSNNSGDTGATLAARLAGLGLPLGPERLVLAGEQCLLRLAKAHPGARVALFAAPPLRALARRIGLRPDRDCPEVALLARDPGFDFADLALLMALAHRGVPVWLTNADPSHPGPDGTPLPETGALWAALAAAVPVAPAGGLGKPAPDLVETALRLAGAHPAEAVFLGDTDATDGAAARAVGVDFVLIRRPGTPAAAADGPRVGAARC